jgi:hypothetical protein
MLIALKGITPENEQKQKLIMKTKSDYKQQILFAMSL